MSNIIKTRTIEVMIETAVDDGICKTCEGSGENWHHDTFRYCSGCGGSGERARYMDVTYQEVTVMSEPVPEEHYDMWCAERGYDPQEEESRQAFEEQKNESYATDYYILFEGAQFDGIEHLKEELGAY